MIPPKAPPTGSGDKVYQPVGGFLYFSIDSYSKYFLYYYHTDNNQRRVP